MRGPGFHTPPEYTQPCPEDNTTEHVMYQIRVWRLTAAPIHPESAREIAGWYASNGVTGRPFATFASSGHIADGLLDSIDREMEDLHGITDRESMESLTRLRALRHYIERCNRPLFPA